jgi:hypothetical protein
MLVAQRSMVNKIVAKSAFYNRTTDDQQQTTVVSQWSLVV